MSKIPPHSKILIEAGREFLRPMGLMQRGGSRGWLDDRAWWAIVVEFQPSGFSKGSYLNVGCMWLWNVKDYASFDVGSRVDGFRKFESEETFRTVAYDLARRAAEEVANYRAQFRSIDATSDYFSENSPAQGWPMFNAAIAFGLSGKPDRARQLFGGVRALPDSAAWMKDLEADARVLDRLVGDTKEFRSLIVERVRQARTLQKLPVVEAINFSQADVC